MTREANFPRCITIEVTQQDINEGRPSDCSSCPIALAAGRRFSSHIVHTAPTFTRIGIVNATGLRILATYFHTEEAIEFIKKFDQGEEVKPVTLSLGLAP